MPGSSALGCGIFGFISLGFLADAIGRKPTAMLYYAMCLILTPVVYLWAQVMGALLAAVAVFGFFTGGIWSWAPIWLPELFPTRMRGTAVAFCFNAPRWISCAGPLIAGTLIVGLGGYGPAATIVGLFFILGVVAAPFLPETKGKPLPETLAPGLPPRRSLPADRQRAFAHFEALQAPQKSFIPSSDWSRFSITAA